MLPQRTIHLMSRSDLIFMDSENSKRGNQSEDFTYQWTFFDLSNKSWLTIEMKKRLNGWMVDRRDGAPSYFLSDEEVKQLVKNIIDGKIISKGFS